MANRARKNGVLPNTRKRTLMDVFPDQKLAARMDGVEGLAWLEVAELHKTLFPYSDLTVERVADGYAIFPRAGSVHMHVLALGLASSIPVSFIERHERTNQKGGRSNVTLFSRKMCSHWLDEYFLGCCGFGPVYS
jgi:hypothetical protein